MTTWRSAPARPARFTSFAKKTCSTWPGSWAGLRTREVPMTASSPTGDDVQSPIDRHTSAAFAPDRSGAPVVRFGSLPHRPPVYRKLVASLQQVYLALYAAEVGVWEWDVVENTMTWSLCVDKIFGLSPKRAKPSCTELFQQMAPDDLGRGKELLEQVLKRG